MTAMHAKIAVYVCFITLMILALTACQTAPPPEPMIETKIVNVPVPVPCSPGIGPRPVYPDTPGALRSVPDIFRRTQLLLAGREARIAREGELEAALSACSEIPE